LTCPRHLSRVLLWIVLTLVAAPKHAVAQDPGRFEVAGGYLALEDYDSDMTFPGGWFGSLALDVAGPVAAMSEATGSYKSTPKELGDLFRPTRF
jgi:hypothetical protein